ncbi:MAG: hypothetical protein HY072_10195 [Deltaproteobacteria bacterium]|nr:hypothetical protein [Deltaproteobacteria bacterium]
MSQNCPSGYNARTLTHSIASNLLTNTSDIQRGTRVCVDQKNIDHKKQNGLGQTFLRGWYDGKTVPMPENAFLGETKNELSALQPESEISITNMLPKDNRFFGLKSSTFPKVSAGEFHLPNSCVLNQRDQHEQEETEQAENSLEENFMDQKNTNEDRIFDPETNPQTDPNGLMRATADDSEKAARNIAQQDLFQSILAARKAVYEAIEEDDQNVSEPYRQIPFSALGKFLEQSKAGLNDLAQSLDQTKEGIESSEKFRFASLTQLAQEKTLLSLGAFQKEINQQSYLGATMAFKELFSPPSGNPLSRTPELSEIFNNPSLLKSENLVNRLILFHGLPKQEQDLLLKKLKLVEFLDLVLENGTKKKISLLHNGYFLGGGLTGTDCSLLASSALPVEMRKGKFTSLDFRAMWIYRRKGVLPMPPRYKKDRAELIKKVSKAFVPINVYAGEKPMVGDLLVYRLPWETSGHVFVVKSYDPKFLTAEVIEASQSAGTIRERVFALSTDPIEEKNRIIRAGLFNLRLKPKSNQVCQYHGGTI